jgi:hypothetical protein
MKKYSVLGIVLIVIGLVFGIIKYTNANQKTKS